MFSLPYDEVARIIALLSSALITIGSYDQVWRIWKRRSVADISPSYIFLAGINEVTWLNYGIAIHEWPIILVGVVNFPACVLAIWGSVKFREPKQKAKPTPLEPLAEKTVL